MRLCKLARLDKNWSQHTLAVAARLNQPLIAAIELGRWNPTPDQLDSLARALDVPACALLDEVSAHDLVVAHD